MNQSEDNVATTKGKQKALETIHVRWWQASDARQASKSHMHKKKWKQKHTQPLRAYVLILFLILPKKEKFKIPYLMQGTSGGVSWVKVKDKGREM